MNTKTEKATGLPVLTDAEQAAARKDGVKEATKESAKDNFERTHDGALYGDPDDVTGYPGPFEVSRLEYVLALSIDELKKALDPKLDNPLTDRQVAGLLEAERSGQNRTEYVKLLFDRLPEKHVGEVTGAGPAFTNDVTPVTGLDKI